MKRSARAEPKYGHRAQGFTIAELVIALVVASLVMVAVSTSVSRIGRSRELAQLRLTAHQRGIDALESIRRDVSSTIRTDDLFLTRVVLSEGASQLRDTLLDRSELLVFVSRLNPVREVIYNGEGLEYETQYRVMDDQDGSALWRRRDPAPDDTPEGGGLAEVVADGVVGVTFEAYDGESWWRTWDSDEDGLPMAVRVTVAASGAGADVDALASPEAIISLRTVIPIDRVPTPRDEEAEQLAREEMMAMAEADAAAEAEAAAAAAAPPSAADAIRTRVRQDAAAAKGGGLGTATPQGGGRGGRGGAGGRGGGGGAGGTGGAGGGGGGRGGGGGAGTGGGGGTGAR